MEHIFKASLCNLSFLASFENLSCFFEVALLRILSNQSILLLSDLKSDFLVLPLKVVGDMWASSHNMRNPLY